MFKFQAFRRLVTYTLLVVYVAAVSVSASAMHNGKHDGHGNQANNPQNIILAAHLLVAAFQNGGVVLEQAAQAAPQIFEQLVQLLPVALHPGGAAPAPIAPPVAATPARRAAPRTLIPTPHGHRRVVPGQDFFGTPRTLESRGVYIHTQDEIAFEPIDVGGHPITEEEAFDLLEQHPQQEALIELLPPLAPNFNEGEDRRERCEKYRYAGKTKGKMMNRFANEINAAVRKNDRPSRHFQGIRGGFVRFGRAIFINTRDEDNWDIERALIRFTRANWGLGLNSNGGSKSKKRSLESDLDLQETDGDDEDEFGFLAEDCRPESKWPRWQEDGGGDGDSGDGNSSDGATFSAGGSQQGSFVF